MEIFMRTITPMAQLLREHGACVDALKWSKRFNTKSEAWQACERPDWMLWALYRLHLDDVGKDRLFACRCVRETPLLDGRKIWDLLTDRSRAAVEVAERFARGEATRKMLDAAFDSSSAAVYDADNPGAAWAARSATNSVRAAIHGVFATSVAVSDAASDAVRAAKYEMAHLTEGVDALAATKFQANLLREIYGNPFAD